MTAGTVCAAMMTPAGPPLRELCAELAAAVAMLLAETGGPSTPAQAAAADALERARAAGAVRS